MQFPSSFSYSTSHLQSMSYLTLTWCLDYTKSSKINNFSFLLSIGIHLYFVKAFSSINDYWYKHSFLIWCSLYIYIILVGNFKPTLIKEAQRSRSILQQTYIKLILIKAFQRSRQYLQQTYIKLTRKFTNTLNISLIYYLWCNDRWLRYSHVL